MAINDEIRQQRKKLKGKGIKAHLAWFWEYEKVPTLIAVLVIGFFGALIYHYVTYKPYVFGTMFLNAGADSDQSDALSEEFLSYAGLNPDEEDVFADLTEMLSLGGDTASSEYDMYSVQKIMAETAAGQIDVAVMDAWYFNHYAYNGEYLDLREVLDDDMIAEYEDRFFYIDQAKAEALQNAQDDKEDTGEEEETAEEKKAYENPDTFAAPDPSEMENPVPVGIICTDAPYIQKNGNYKNAVCVAGIVASTKHPETCQQFLEYLFEK